MLSASEDFVTLNLWQGALLGPNGKWSKNSSEIYTYKFKMLSSSGDFVPWMDQRLALPLDPTGVCSQTILQVRSTTLAQILQSYIIPSRSLRSSSTTMSAPLRETRFSRGKCLELRFWEERSLFSFSENVLQQWRIQKFSRRQYSGPRFREEESLFLFSENVPKLTCIQQSRIQNYPGDNTPDPVLWERKVCFCTPKMYQNSPTAM